jgi:hypothetical protein
MMRLVILLCLLAAVMGASASLAAASPSPARPAAVPTQQPEAVPRAERQCYTVAWTTLLRSAQNVGRGTFGELKSAT